MSTHPIHPQLATHLTNQRGKTQPHKWRTLYLIHLTGQANKEHKSCCHANCGFKTISKKISTQQNTITINKHI